MGGFQRGGGGGGGQGVRPPPPEKITKNRVSKHTSPEPLKITELPKSAFHVGSSISETPFKWRFAGMPMMARLKWCFGSSLPSSKLDPPPPIKLSGWVIMFYVQSPLSCAKATHHVLTTTAMALILDIMLSLRLFSAADNNS